MALGFDGVVRGDVRSVVRILREGGLGMETIEIGGEIFVTGFYAVEDSGMGFANGFAIPAGALAVNLVEHLLVGLGCPFEGVREAAFVDFVVVVDESTRFRGGVGVVGFTGELVGVPGKIDVEGRDGDFVGVFAHDGEKAGVFDEQAVHGCADGRRMQPVYGVHFFDEDALTDDSAHQVNAKHGRVVPITRHHAANCNSFRPSKPAS